MAQRVAVLGATGVYGRHLLPRLAAAGWAVRALVRRPEAAGVAAACGAEVVRADLFDAASLRSALAGCDIAINLATHLPGPATPAGDFALTDRMRREGTLVWLQACADAQVPRVLQQSIAMTHAGGGEAWADESTFPPIEGDGIFANAVRAVRDMEAHVTASPLDWSILRGALFYGPGTGFDDDWFARARAGALRLPLEGQDHVSLVHVADMAAATVAALQRWPSCQALIVADDAPPRWSELFGHVCALAGSAPPAPGGRQAMQPFRVTNRRARDLLGWAPRYPDFRSGLAR
jgi:nucleoside-diphosphate-sugar epimerase